ncbi:MAG: T9SS type A sorting domain-containing protein, partial [bacterium]
GNVSLKIFNVLGQVVASLVDTKQDAGRYTITFDASKISSGIYFYQISVGNFSSTKKMTFLK